VHEARLMKHPQFPESRPGFFKAMLMGLTQAAQSFHVHSMKQRLKTTTN